MVIFPYAIVSYSVKTTLCYDYYITMKFELSSAYLAKLHIILTGRCWVTAFLPLKSQKKRQKTTINKKSLRKMQNKTKNSGINHSLFLSFYIFKFLRKLRILPINTYLFHNLYENCAELGRETPQ